MIIKKFFLPVSLLSGAIIGAGMFSLPYAFSKVGLAIGFLYFLILTTVVIFIHLLYADIILRTKKEHNFIGYVREYLGEKISRMAFFISVVEMIIVLVIYLILSASFFHLMFQQDSAIAVWVFIFWLFGSLAIFTNLKEISELQFVITLAMIVIVFTVFLLGLGNDGQEKIVHSVFDGSLRNIFFPVGPILFALSGRVAIVELIRYFSPKKPINEIKNAVIWGTAIPAIFYSFFILGVFGLSDLITKDAVGGLINVLPSFILSAFGVLGILALWTSYVAVAYDINNIFKLDLKLNSVQAGLIIIFLPIIFYLAGFNDFIFLISLVGGVFLVIEGILILEMWLTANKKLSSKPKLITLNSSAIIFISLILVIALTQEVWKALIPVVKFF